MTFPAARRLARDAAVLALALPLGCGGSDGPGSPVAPAPPLIARVEPAARAQRVAIDTPIWAEFTEALDPATVTTANVRLKVDTERIPIQVAWDSAARRIRLAPDHPLDLRRTHTVELDERLRTASGASLTGGWYWQFTTTSARIPHSPQPLDGTTGESPFVLLRWQGLTESRAGAVEYRLRVTSDSVAALDPDTPPLAVLTGGRLLPRARWSQDRTNWWSVEVHNLDTGERVWSRAWRFDCLPADTPADTIDVPPGDHAWFNGTTNNRVCGGDSVVSGTLLTAAIRWTLPEDSTRKLAGAVIELMPFAHWRTAVSRGVSVWLATSNWGFCALGYPGPPYTDEASGRLAETTTLESDRVRFASDALTAHVEAMGRVGGHYGYIFRSVNRMSYWSPLNQRGRLRVVVYRAPAGAAARNAGSVRRFTPENPTLARSARRASSTLLESRTR